MTQRKRRQLTLGVALFSFAVSALTSAGSSGVTAAILETEMDNKLTALEGRINDKFTKQNQQMQALAERINGVEAQNVAQNQAIVNTITEALKLETLTNARETELQTQITETQRILIAHLQQNLNITRIELKETLAELELEKQVIKWIRNHTGEPLFNNTEVYEGRIEAGSLYFRKYAQLTRNFVTELTENSTRIRQSQEKLQKKVEETLEDLNQTKYEALNLSLTAPPPITIANYTPIAINFSSMDLTPKEITHDIIKGLTVIPDAATGVIKDITNDVGDVVSNGAQNLARIIAPIVGVTVLAAAGAMAVKYYKGRRNFRQRMRKIRGRRRHKDPEKRVKEKAPIREVIVTP